MNFTDFVVYTGVEQNTFGSSGFTGVDVRTDTDITVACDGCLYEPFDSSLISLGVQLSYPKRATYLKRPPGDYDSEGITNGSVRTPCWLLPYGERLHVS
ncbi:Uncharacterised protein [Salmonella sp. NCTC 11881]|nr:Uncharacterised protein [Salmonella sp. NCTC 11881]